MAFFGVSRASSSSLLLLLLVLTSTNRSHAQGGRGDNDACSNWNETAVALEAHNKTLHSGLQEHSSCYDFEYTYRIYSPDPPSTVQVQVRNGVAQSFDPNRAFNSIPDVMDLIYAQCVEGCAEIAAAMAENNDSSTTRVYDQTPLEPAHQCQVDYDDTTGVPTRVWVDRFSFIADEEYTYTIDNFQWVDCEKEAELEESPLTDSPPDVEETTDAPPEVEETTDAPPPEETTDAPPEMEETTDAPPEIEETTDTPPEVEETTDAPPPEETTDVPPEVEETTDAPPEFEETTDAPPPEETTDAPPEVEETTDAPPEAEEPATCNDYEQVKADLETAQETWPDYQCYQFMYTQGEESVLVQVKDGTVVQVLGDVQALTMNELMDDLYQLCVANCPENGAEQCSVTFAEDGYIMSASIKPSETAVEEVTYEVTYFEVLDCNDPAFVEGASSASFVTLYLALALPIALIKLMI